MLIMKNLIKISSIVILTAGFITSCTKVTEPEPDVQISIDEMYSNAISDAMLAEENEIYNNLTAIVPSNPSISWNEDSSMVLVISWTSYPDSYPVHDTVSCWWGDTWVTAVPDLEIWVNSHVFTIDDPSLRLKQLLGLAPEAEHSHFVEFWASTEDLFRPAPDSEITDSVCDLMFPDDVDPEYVEWFNNNILYSYFPPRYPWTRLGYTYDWGSPDTAIGLSEFVLRKNAEIIIERVLSTEEYVSQIR